MIHLHLFDLERRQAVEAKDDVMKKDETVLDVDAGLDHP